MRHSKLERLIARYFVFPAALLLPFSCANAQVGFIADLMLSHLCIIQNWDTPRMQGMLKKMPMQGRMQLFGGVRFSSKTKRCLMETKPASVALCDRVIADHANFRERLPIGGGTPFQTLSPSEEHKLWNSFGNSACKLDNVDDGSDTWVPKDLLPSPSTVKLLERAERDDVQAQMASYDLYVRGIDVPEDLERALYWLQRAANLGNIEAQYLLGRRYSFGKMPDGADFAKAIHFLTEAANRGHQAAMTLLASIYEQPTEDGNGFAPPEFQDMKKSLEWYVKAANLGAADAAFALGLIYAAGDPVPLDLAKSLFWYEKSAEGLRADAMLRVSELYQAGKGTTSNPRVAQQWLSTALEN